MKLAHYLLTCTAILALSLPAFAHADTTTAPAVVASSTTYDGLRIAPDAIPAAPSGKLLTMTVAGVEQAIAPGDYQGNVTLTVTDDIAVKYKTLPEHHFRSALYIDNGAPVWEKSVKAALGGGVATQGKADNLVIRSQGERFNGVIVTGDGRYVLNRPVIDLTGNGGNDFAGFGAAVMATGKAEVTLERPVIRTKGAIRSALFVGEDAVMRVNNAVIETMNGTLPSDYKFTVDVGRMMEVPWMLGLSGNVRSVNMVDNATLYITGSYIRSQGWGALSTDDSKHVRMYVKDTVVELSDAGYGTYSIGDAHNIFEHSVIRSPDIGAIMAAQGSLTLTDHTIVEAGTYGVMMHSGTGGGTLTIDKGSEIKAGRAAIEVKGIGTTIIVDGAKVSSSNGIILQAMENDDPFLVALMRGELPPGMTELPPGMSANGGSAADKKPTNSSSVTATFRNIELVGDFWNGRTSQGGMDIGVENAKITGRISTSITAPRSGRAPTKETYREIGDVINTATPTKTGNGATVRLGQGGRWTVTGTSYLTRLAIEQGGMIDGGAKKLTLRVNGKVVPVRAGTYSGKIELAVN